MLTIILGCVAFILLLAFLDQRETRKAAEKRNTKDRQDYNDLLTDYKDMEVQVEELSKRLDTLLYVAKEAKAAADEITEVD